MEMRARKLGRYEIVAELGRGAMGVVYKASDPKIDRFVAIKTISLNGAPTSEHREFRDRFFIEAQAAGRLIHPGIVTVFDVDEDRETLDPFIVMEYIEGQNLRDILVAKATKSMPVDRALQIAQDIAEALDYAHAQGVVHRDVKPANILITKDGQAKITDFGIAQLDFSHITLPGRAIGTPAYMSPEQLEGGPVDGRSDLFSLGAILYSLVTGFSPFQGNSATTVCFKVVNREPLSATTLAPELPPELDAVIARALAKDPQNRYPNGMEFAHDLRELLEHVAPQPAGSLERAERDTFWFQAGKTGMPRADLKVAQASHGRSGDYRPSAANASEKSSRTFTRAFLAAGPGLGAMTILLLAALAVGFITLRQQRQAPNPISEATDTAPAQRVNQPQLPPTANLESSSPSGVPFAVARKPVTTSPATTSATLDQISANHVASTRSRKTSPVADSNVQIDVENHFAQAQLSIWIDDKLQYQHPLNTIRRRLVFLNGSRDTVTLPVVAGEHQLRVRVLSEPDQYDEENTISGEFDKGGQKTLTVSFEKHTRQMHLLLR